MTPLAPAVVCVAGVGDAPDPAVEAVLATVPPGTRVLTAGGPTVDGAEPLSHGGEGPLSIAIAAAEAVGRSDLVLVHAGAVLPPGWLAALQDASLIDTTIASASAMCPGAPPVPDGLVNGGTAAEAAVDRWSVRARPRIAAPGGSAVLLRRPALDAAGPLDATVGDLAVALADWGNRCTALGLGHVLADDVLAPGAPAASDAQAIQELDARWPQRRARVATLEGTPTLERALRAVSRGVKPVSITLDGRVLSRVQTGTQVHALELSIALLRTERTDVRVLVPPDLDEEARAALAQGGARLLGYQEAAAGGVEPTDVVHRPTQVFSADDLLLLAPLGRRLVITHQDLIAYRIPDYHETPDYWERYRSVTREALGAADHVVFFSPHALRDALSEDLVQSAHASVIPIGIDHAAVTPSDASPPPTLAADDGGHLLCLGSDLRHKHRVFALRLLQELLAEGWQGRLVLAGGHAPYGSSREEEDRLLEGMPLLAAAVTRIEAVSEAERRWLTEKAAAVVYPSLYEGFGLVPFESASAGVPALFASETSLADVLPGELAVLRPWDPAASARAALPLLTEGTARRAHVDAIRAAAAELTWDRTANALVDRFEQLVAAPPREAVTGARTRLRLLQQIDESERIRRAEAARFEEYTAAIGPDGLSLVGPDGLLDARDQRALLAIASRRGSRKLLFSALRGVYRLAHRAAHRAR